MSIYSSVESAGIRGYINTIPPESNAARAARHLKITERRKGPIVLVHRGASSFAPENTLEAYAAAMDYGADGCEVDIRKTTDGIFVMFHDDMLDYLTNGFGKPEDLTYYELLSLNRRRVYGTAGPDVRYPTLVSLLTLARQRSMLLFLDIKQPGQDQEVAKLLDEADMWDHIVAINLDTCQNILKDPRCQLLRFKAPGLYEQKLDVDPEAVQSALEKPGEMIILDDPRVATRELKRPAYKPQPLPNGLRQNYEPAASSAAPSEFVPMSYLKKLQEKVDPNSVNQLESLLQSDTDEWDKPDGSNTYMERRVEHIIARAWAAERLAELKSRSPSVIKALEDQVKRRSLHRDWIYHGIDGASAVRALGKSGNQESAQCLINTFVTVDPALAKVANPEYRKSPLSWTDWRIKEVILFALGDLKSEAGKKFLLDYLSMDKEKSREIAMPMTDAVVKSLMKHDLSQKEIESLLRSPDTIIRGTATLECLDYPTTARTNALKAAAAWALELPRAKSSRKQ